MSCSTRDDLRSSSVVLEASEIFRDFLVGNTQVRALVPVSITVRHGEFVVISGPSGSGKSTLLSLLSGMDRPSGGDVSFRGKSLRNLTESELAKVRNKYFGFIFQSPYMLYSRTVLENISLPARYNPTLNFKDALKRAHTLLDYVGLSSLAKRFPNTLSGGELQRVAFARALLCDPEVIFADEPTGSLDAENSLKLLELLQEQCTEKRVVVMVTHNEEAISYGSRVIGLDKFNQKCAEIYDT